MATDVHSDRRAHDAKTLELLHRDLEFRYQQLQRRLEVQPRGKVVIFYFPSAEAKKDLVGAGGTLFTKPWRREVFFCKGAYFSAAGRVPFSRLIYPVPDPEPLFVIPATQIDGNV